MGVRVVNLGSLVLAPERRGVRFEVHRSALGERLGGEKLALATVVVPPGKVDAPCRFHLRVEEMALVLGGEPHLRIGGAEHRLAAGDAVALPPRVSSAWQVLNRGERPAHLLVAGTRGEGDVMGLPDSRKKVYRVGGDGEPVRNVVLGERGVTDLYEGEDADVPLGPAPPEPAARDPRIANVEEAPWEAFGRIPFGGERRRLSRRTGAVELGYSLYRIAPGRQAFPFHFHHVNEEFFYLRRGYGRLRTVDGERDVGPGDAFLCRAGVGGAHSVMNTGDATLEYFALSTMADPEVLEYPDTGETHVMVGAPPGGDPRRRVLDRIFRRGERGGET